MRASRPHTGAWSTSAPKSRRLVCGAEGPCVVSATEAMFWKMQLPQDHRDAVSPPVSGLLPRHKRNAVGRSTRESVAVVYPASGVSFIELVPTWNLRTGSHTF